MSVLRMSEAEWARRLGPIRKTIARNKFHAVKTTVDGLHFDSKKEARRYQELRLLQMAGEIGTLDVQPKFDLFAFSGAWSHGFTRSPMALIGHYTADFRIVYATGEIVIEDVKSEPSKTTAYRLRKRIFEANYWPLIITEI